MENSNEEHLVSGRDGNIPHAVNRDILLHGVVGQLNGDFAVVNDSAHSALVEATICRDKEGKS